MDAQSLIDEVMKGDVYFFMVTVTATLDKRSELAAVDLQSKDDPASSCSEDRGPSPSFVKPLKPHVQG